MKKKKNRDNTISHRRGHLSEGMGKVLLPRPSARLRGVSKSKSGKFSKFILLLKMNLEGFIYNLQETEPKSAF